jgi:hypothetical protein
VSEVTVEGSELVVHLSFLEKLESFRGDRRFPMACVRSVEIVAKPSRTMRGVKGLGTGFPGLGFFELAEPTAGRT